MDMANLSRRPRLRQKRDRFWLTVGLCALTAALIFLPFQIIDGGVFHYAGGFNGPQNGFYPDVNGLVKGPGAPAGPGTAGGARRRVPCPPPHRQPGGGGGLYGTRHGGRLVGTPPRRSLHLR